MSEHQVDYKNKMAEAQADVEVDQQAAEEEVIQAAARELINERARKLLEHHAKRIGVQDGVNKTALREWLEEITSAQEWSGANQQLTLSTVGYLVKGRLDTSVRRWIREYEAENAIRDADAQENITWARIRKRIEQEFLGADEQEYLRKAVDEMQQGVLQDVREYARDFDQAVHRAYTADELDVAVVMERLIRTFIAGIRSGETRLQIHAARPETLEAAYERALTMDRARSLAGVRGRKEEPMEIGGLQKKVTTTHPEPGLQKVLDTIKNLESQMGEMQRKLDEKRRGRGKGPQKLKSMGLPAWTSDGQPICFRCCQAGHMAKDKMCPSSNMGPNMPSTGNGK